MNYYYNCHRYYANSCGIVGGELCAEAMASKVTRGRREGERRIPWVVHPTFTTTHTIASPIIAHTAAAAGSRGNLAGNAPGSGIANLAHLNGPHVDGDGANEIPAFADEQNVVPLSGTLSRRQQA